MRTPLLIIVALMAASALVLLSEHPTFAIDTDTLAITSPPGTGAFGLVINQAASSGGNGGVNPYAFNSITTGGYNQSSYGTYFQRQLATRTWIHPQTVITTLVEVNGEPRGTSNENDAVSLQSFARGNANVLLRNNVNLFSGNDFTETIGTGYQYVIGREVDVGIRSGGAAIRKLGVHVLSFGPIAGDAGRDTAYNIAKFSPDASPWHKGLHWESDAFNEKSTIIGGTGTTKAGTALDFSGVDLVGNLIASNGFIVGNKGQTYIGLGQKFSLGDFANANRWSLDYATPGALTFTHNDSAPLVAIDISGGVRSAGGFWSAGLAGKFETITVRDAAGTGTCTLEFTGGLKTGGTCVGGIQ